MKSKGKKLRHGDALYSCTLFHNSGGGGSDENKQSSWAPILPEQVSTASPPQTVLLPYYCVYLQSALQRKLPLAPKISPGSHRLGGHSPEWYMPSNKKVSK